MPIFIPSPTTRTTTGNIVLLGFERDLRRQRQRPPSRRGFCGAGQGNAQIQQCPSFEGGADWADNPYTGYNYNTSYIGHGQDEDIEQPAKTSAVLHPAKTVIFGDGQYASRRGQIHARTISESRRRRFLRTLFRHAGLSPPEPQQRRLLRRPRRILADCCTNSSEPFPIAPGTGFLSISNSMYDLN